MQTETDISTTDLEIIAMAHSCKKLYPIMDMVNILGQSFGMHVRDATINVSTNKENEVVLVLAETLPPQIKPQSKNYATITIWFGEETFKRGINLLVIDTFRNWEIFLQKDILRQNVNTHKIIRWGGKTSQVCD